jgi:protein-L-isoaspartate(D-aspartate) O-methyltransferase
MIALRRFLPMIGALALLAVAALVTAQQASPDETRYARQRAAMVETIRKYASSERDRLGPRGISKPILDAMAQTKRHLFIPERYRSLAYADQAVPIAYGQTISQPYVVALMTHLAAPRPDHTVLEIGTGSGYQAAILAKLVRKVCTMEIIRPLGDTAAKLLKDLGHDNVEARVGDGYQGWPECGPFDAIIVTAALDHVPPPLIAQLKVGGRLVMPVGSLGFGQQLSVVEKLADGKTQTRLMGLVSFVPFTRSRK